jgi:hypothetical protein
MNCERIDKVTCLFDNYEVKEWEQINEGWIKKYKELKKNRFYFTPLEKSYRLII